MLHFKITLWRAMDVTMGVPFFQIDLIPTLLFLGCDSQVWAGLPPDFHWAKNSEKPQDSEFSQQRLREYA